MGSWLVYWSVEGFSETWSDEAASRCGFVIVSWCLIVIARCDTSVCWFGSLATRANVPWLPTAIPRKDNQLLRGNKTIGQAAAGSWSRGGASPWPSSGLWSGSPLRHGSRRRCFAGVGFPSRTREGRVGTWRWTFWRWSKEPAGGFARRKRDAEAARSVQGESCEVTCEITVDDVER